MSFDKLYLHHIPLVDIVFNGTALAQLAVQITRNRNEIGAAEIIQIGVADYLFKQGDRLRWQLGFHYQVADEVNLFGCVVELGQILAGYFAS